MTTREQVANALFDLLSASASYATTSRRFKTWSQIQSVQKPALFLTEPEEQHSKQKLITPAVRTLDFEAFIFIATGLDPNVIPATELNNLIDAIDPNSGGVLKPDNNGQQTLGGLVTNTYIDGKVTKVPGDLDGNGVAIIPIKVIFM